MIKTSALSALTVFTLFTALSPAFAGAPAPQALIYDGVSAAYDDPQAIADILQAHGVESRRVTSDDLNAMTLDELGQYKLIAWPGGYAGNMSDSLAPAARERIRRAVTEQGVGYVGFCAGAFIAVGPATKAGAAGPESGLALVPQAALPYYHLEDEGTDDAMVKLTLAGGGSRQLIWWGGPYLPEFPKGVIARYADTNQPAIAQIQEGKGLVLLSGPHPEAPESWRTKLGLNDSDGLDQDIAWNLFNAAIQHQPLPVLN